ncbi:unnamed protein product [Staurois parvus]|uniref:Uncharacterized protein n=1 Tax=Staurois parvus TaxID=386267 RepID=A0ABN9CRN4_9NEOB|nr:unnamed protein product [Staurois parvus]
MEVFVTPKSNDLERCPNTFDNIVYVQGRTDHLETRALPEGPGSVGGPMRCPWYLFHRLF